MKQQRVKSVTVEYADENVTSFGGLSLVERLALRLGLWRELEKRLPHRRGHFDWRRIIKSAVMGLLSDARGTYATEPVRQDSALLDLLGLEDAPEEATFWRTLEGLGRKEIRRILAKVQRLWTRTILSRATRRDLLREGFLPVFGDGTLLEGSDRREGTKYQKGKGTGLLWATWFCGPLIAAQRLAGEGEGEQSSLRAMLEEVIEEILVPLNLKEVALVLMDSLHGDGPTLDDLERHRLHYIVGANKLDRTEMVLQDCAEWEWRDTGAKPQLGWSESAVCVCSIQCEGWSKKRTLVGRRWKREGELLWEYAGVITDLSEQEVSHLMKRGRRFAQAIWRLYDTKAGLEDHYKDPLEDLNLHHPPCQELVRNQGFYAVATLAHTLGRAVDLIGGKSAERGSMKRKDGGRRKRPKPRRMRLWRLRRLLFTLSGRVTCHARTAAVTLLGLSQPLRKLFEHFWVNICRC
jgi:hypothetical protein